jgi:hypothetical protein
MPLPPPRLAPVTSATVPRRRAMRPNLPRGRSRSLQAAAKPILRMPRTGIPASVQSRPGGNFVNRGQGPQRRARRVPSRARAAPAAAASSVPGSGSAGFQPQRSRPIARGFDSGPSACWPRSRVSSARCGMVRAVRLSGETIKA